jgi:transcriptional regulator with XRE-family HTH domain
MSLLTGSQLRAARALLRLEQQDLADEAGVGITTLRRIESFDDRMAARHDTVMRLQRALERRGVEFTNGEGPGVRLRRASPTA